MKNLELIESIADFTPRTPGVTTSEEVKFISDKLKIYKRNIQSLKDLHNDYLQWFFVNKETKNLNHDALMSITFVIDMAIMEHKTI